MARAGVFIGVDKTGNLHPLHDAAAGARRMHEWALAQGMADKTHAVLITDENNQKVTVDRVFDALAGILGGAGVEQLIVYFAGHGISINMSEHWLLSDAPLKRSAAIDVRLNAELAKECAAQYVVMISDACRVPPEGLQAQRVQGIEIFPNVPSSTRAKPVDQFFACRLGMTAAELPPADEATGAYQALYTGALLEALNGQRPDVLEPAVDPGDDSLYLRPLKLDAWLEAEVRRRIVKQGFLGKVNQSPEAYVVAQAKPAWLARVPLAVAARSTGPMRDILLGPGMREPDTPRLAARRIVRSAARGDLGMLDTELLRARASAPGETQRLADGAAALATPFGPEAFETQCGIKVQGARIAAAEMAVGHAQQLSPELVRVDQVPGAGASVLLRFEGGSGSLIPALPGFIAALRFDGDELVDVAYEPSQNHSRWSDYQSRAAELRRLRAVAAAASRAGRFRLDGDDAQALAQQMQFAKGIDPTLAVYAAYAYHDLQATERIRTMAGYLQGDLGMRWFDVALLARELVDATINAGSGVLPFMPLLAQGWPMLRAHRVQWAAPLAGLEATLKNSLWSLYDASGVEILSRAMQSRNVR
jgi:hypothetical protein